MLTLPEKILQTSMMLEKQKQNCEYLPAVFLNVFHDIKV